MSHFPPPNGTSAHQFQAQAPGGMFANPGAGNVGPGPQGAQLGAGPTGVGHSALGSAPQTGAPHMNGHPLGQGGRETQAQAHAYQQQTQLAYQQAQLLRQTSATLQFPYGAASTSALPTSGALPSRGQTGPAPPLPSAIQQAALLRATGLPPHSSVTPTPVPLPTSNSSPNPSLSAPTDGGPPFNVPLLGMFTKPSPLGPGVPFPSISKEDQVKVKAWMAKDTAYEKEIMAVKRARKGEFQEMAEDVMRSQDWLGEESSSRNRLKIRMESDRTKEMQRGKRGANRKEVKFTKESARQIAKLPEVLIPVRLEYEHEAYKLRDTFTWNLREILVTPEIFASHLCEDLRLPSHPFYKEIVTQIKRHIEEAQVIEEYAAHIGDDLAQIRRENREWFESERKRRKVEKGAREDYSDHVTEPEEAPVTLRDLEMNDGKDEELRVLIKLTLQIGIPQLDITLDSFQLVDRFEWDISDPYNSPEDFAEVFVADLGLGGEFRTAVAHSIREQVDVYVKSLCLLGHVTGDPIPDDDLRREFLPPLFEPFRSEVGDFQPVLSQLSPDEVERNDKEREREVRRKRRQTKGRGVTLPDRDPVKTHRTLVPRPSVVPLHSYQDSRGDMVYPMPEMSKPYPIARPPGGDKPPPPTKPAKTHEVGSPPVGDVLVESGLVGAGSGGRLRRLRKGDSATSQNSMDPAASSGTTNETGTRATTPQPSDTKSHPGPVKNSPFANRLKKKAPPPVIQASLEELGLHEHMIDGQWYCANCGVPDALAVGRRKGQSGHNTLCGACGKYFHRYRRNRPCEYTTDLSTHQRFKEAAVKAAIKAGPTKERKSRKAKLEHAAAPEPPASFGSSAPIPKDNDEDEDEDEEDEEEDNDDRQEPYSRRVPDESSEDSEAGDNDSDSSSTVSNAPRQVRDRANSPDLPYVDVGSPDSGMSSLSPSPPPLPDYSSFEAAGPPPAAAVEPS
ncbi:SWI/SNF-related matrix-associated actin-dependent regulator of chromatin subfamily B member 1, partial [Phenoliferia sp. Uapishka_3]